MLVFGQFMPHLSYTHVYNFQKISKSEQRAQQSFRGTKVDKLKGKIFGAGAPKKSGPWARAPELIRP